MALYPDVLIANGPIVNPLPRTTPTPAPSPPVASLLTRLWADSKSIPSSWPEILPLNLLPETRGGGKNSDQTFSFASNETVSLYRAAIFDRGKTPWR